MQMERSLRHITFEHRQLLQLCLVSRNILGKISEICGFGMEYVLIFSTPFI